MIKSHFKVEEDPGAAHRQKGKQRCYLLETVGTGVDVPGGPLMD